MQTAKKVRAAVSAPKRSRRRIVPGVTGTKLAISFDAKLAKQVQAAARKRTGGNVSAWLAEAAADHLRHDVALELLELLQEGNEPATKEELEAVRREWLG
jgi:hypothetical protein